MANPEIQNEPNPLAERPLAMSNEELKEIADKYNEIVEKNALSDDEKRQIPEHGKYNLIEW